MVAAAESPRDFRIEFRIQQGGLRANVSGGNGVAGKHAGLARDRYSAV